MKKIALLVLVGCTTAFGQNPPIKFGEIPMDDMKMVVYDKDSSAAAVVLADYGVSYVNYANGEFKLNIEQHTRIKILKNEGLSYADGSMLIYHRNTGEEKIMNLKATSYNLENGKIVETKLTKEGIFREKIGDNYDRQKFTIPNVKVGSVIEYSYRKTSEFYWRFPNWKFQYSIPARWSEYWAMIPKEFTYQKYMQGYVAVKVNDQTEMNYFGESVIGYHWLCLDVPAFKEEPYMTTEEDYIARINFALAYYENSDGYRKEVMGTWQTLSRDLLESSYFGAVIDGSGFLKDKVAELTAGIEDPLKKISIISDYVKRNVEYTENEDYQAFPLKKVLEKKKGTSGDINLLFGSMLGKAGLETAMVLLSTRDHGFIRESFPMESQFNYVIVAVMLGDKTLLLDATEKFLPYDVLPDRCLNGRGLVVSKTKSDWIDITSKVKAKTITSADLTLDESGELKGTLQYTRDGYDAQRMRRSYNSTGEAKYLENFANARQWKIEKSQFENVKELSKPARETHNISIGEHSSVAGDIIYISPFVIGQMTENIFKAESRTYPVDYGPLSDDTYMCKIKIPDGFVVDEFPKSKVFALAGNAAKYLYNAGVTGNVISITSTLQINKSLFVQTEYPNLREFYNQVVAKQAELIVIKRK